MRTRIPVTPQLPQSRLPEYTRTRKARKRHRSTHTPAQAETEEGYSAPNSRAHRDQRLAETALPWQQRKAEQNGWLFEGHVIRDDKRTRGLARALVSITRYLGWQPGIITGDFSEILVVPQRSLGATREDDNPLGYEALSSDSMSGPASALIITVCRDEGRLLFWLHWLTFLLCLYGFFTKISNDTEWWRQRKRLYCNGCEGGIAR